MTERRKDFFDFRRLEQAYDKLQETPNDHGAQSEFLAAFPSSWWEFILVYGYHKGDGELNLYSKSPEYISALADCMNLIDDTVYCRKIVHLAVGATIDADAPSHFQELLHAKMAEKTSAMMAELSQLLKPEQILFWQFYWSRLIRDEKSEKECKQLYNSLHSTYPNEMEVMKCAFENFCGEVRFEAD